MARPNMLAYRGDGALQYISDAEFQEITDSVLREFVLTDGPGSIYAGGVAGANTVIGTFTDTLYQGTQGSSDLTILSISTTFYQDLSVNYGSVSNIPITWNTGLQSLKEATDSELDEIAQEILDYSITGDNPGTYRIATSNPGGSWIVVASINNIEDEALTTTYYLYQKLPDYIPDPTSLLKNFGGSLKQMTDSEINELVSRVRKLIVTTGIGQYELASSAPSTGTWENMGTITDTRSDVQSVNYEGASYTGTTAVSYLGTYFGPEFTYDGSYYGTIQVNYFGSQLVSYVGPAQCTNPSNTVYSRGTYTPSSALLYGDGGTSYPQGRIISVNDGIGSIVNQWYFSDLGRDPDKGGFDFWYDQVATYGATTAVRQAFSDGAQAEINRGGATWLTYCEYLEYENLLGTQSYVGTQTVAYTGSASLFFVGSYIGPGISYSGTSTGFAPVNYTATSTGQIVGSGSQTVSSLTLWRRIA